MLNRRKQSPDIDDQQGQDEREYLLNNSSSYGQDAHYSVPSPISNYQYATSSGQPPYGLPIPSQRRTREKSIELAYNNNRLDQPASKYVSNSHLIKKLDPKTISTNNKLHGESYELGTTSLNSYSRTVDITVPVRQQAPIDFIYYNVQPGDTLQNLSVKYSCPVASIKRLNNLWSDQEFYGLSRIKLPAGKLRLIADVINEENLRTNEQCNHQTSLHNPIPSTSSESYVNNNEDDRSPNTLYSLDTASSTVDSPETRSESIFKDYDLSIAKARTAARSYDNNATAILQSLAESGNIVDERDDLNDPNNIARREAENLLNDMTDYGMSYSGLILFIFIVCLIFPLAYVIYLEETHHDSNKSP